MEEPITTVIIEPEPTPQEIQAAPTCETVGADVSTQQPQIDEPVERVTSEPLALEPPTGGSTDHNGPKEQGPVAKDDTVTPDSVPTAPQRQEQQPSNDATEETTPEVGQDIRTEPGILDILEAK